MSESKSQQTVCEGCDGTGRVSVIRPGQPASAAGCPDCAGLGVDADLAALDALDAAWSPDDRVRLADDDGQQRCDRGDCGHCEHQLALLAKQAFELSVAVSLSPAVKAMSFKRYNAAHILAGMVWSLVKGPGQELKGCGLISSGADYLRLLADQIDEAR